MAAEKPSEFYFKVYGIIRDVGERIRKFYHENINRGGIDNSLKLFYAIQKDDPRLYEDVLKAYVKLDTYLRQRTLVGFNTDQVLFRIGRTDEEINKFNRISRFKGLTLLFEEPEKIKKRAEQLASEGH